MVGATDLKHYTCGSADNAVHCLLLLSQHDEQADAWSAMSGRLESDVVYGMSV